MATANPEAATQSDVRLPTSRHPRARLCFSNLPATCGQEQLESLLKPFTIESWDAEESLITSNDGDRKSVTVDVQGVEEHCSGEQMMRQLSRLWCRRNRPSSMEKKESPAPGEESPDVSSITGWLEIRKYDGDNTRVRKADAVHLLTSRSIAFGSFKDQFTFVNHACIGQSTHTLQAKFEHDLKNFSVVFHARNTDSVKKLEMSYLDVEAYVIVDVLLDGFRLFLPLLYPPKVYSSELEELMPYVARPQVFTEGMLWNRDTSISDELCNSDVIGRCSVMCLEYRTSARSHDLTIEDSPLWSLYTRLQRSGFTVYFSAIHGVQHQSVDFISDHRVLKDFETLYAMEGLVSRGSKFLDRCTPELMKLISEAPVHLVAPAITEVAHVWLEDDRFCNLKEAFNKELQTFRNQADDDSTAAEELPPHFVNVRRVVVTPTRILFLRAETIVENRTVRAYGSDRFLRVAFRDEDYGKLMSPVPRFMTKITSRIKAVLKHGIRVGSRCYKFLACSNSQLREHGCWFFAPDGSPETRIKTIRR